MLRKRFLKIIFFLILTMILNLFVIQYGKIEFNNKLELKLSSSVQDNIQVFYDKQLNWSEEKSQKQIYSNVNNIQSFEFIIPNEYKNLRIDFGDSNKDIIIESAKLSSFNKKLDILSIIEDSDTTNDINQIIRIKNGLNIKKRGVDAFVIIGTDKLLSEEEIQKINFCIKITILIFINLTILILIKKRRYIFSIVREVYQNKELVWNLSKNDFKTKYAGSYLGLFWAFINPIVTILIYWFVFEFGLKAAAPIPNTPFILWFTAGMIPWFFFSDSVMNATNSFLEYSYLVKKVVFKISIIPIVKIISSFFIHLVFIGVMMIIYGIYGKIPMIGMIQVLYYSFCTFCLSLALSYATAAIVLFFRDLGQIVGLGLQIGMWMTPIMWSYKIIPQKFQWIAKLNPMYYVVEGYRNVLLNKMYFFEEFWITVYFWGFTFILFFVGMYIFKKLKPHFSDVL